MLALACLYSCFNCQYYYCSAFSKASFSYRVSYFLSKNTFIFLGLRSMRSVSLRHFYLKQQERDQSRCKAMKTQSMCWQKSISKGRLSQQKHFWQMSLALFSKTVMVICLLASAYTILMLQVSFSIYSSKGFCSAILQCYKWMAPFYNLKSIFINLSAYSLQRGKTGSITTKGTIEQTKYRISPTAVTSYHLFASNRQLKSQLDSCKCQLQ